MDETDKRIVEALSAADSHLLSDMQEPAFFRMAFGLYRGRNAWVATVISIVQFAMFVVAMWMAWRFFHTDDAVGALRWGLPAAVFAIVSTQLKMTMMAQLQTDRVLNAVRHMELRLATAR
ncbi:MAG: DUF6768 family protein [bacterium]